MEGEGCWGVAWIDGKTGPSAPLRSQVTLPLKYLRQQQPRADRVSVI